MTGVVVDFETERLLRSPHGQGTARCLACHAEWEAVVPVGTVWLECGECGSMRGMMKLPYGPGVGQSSLFCDACGHLGLFEVMKTEDGRVKVLCPMCGTDNYNGVFGDG